MTRYAGRVGIIQRVLPSYRAPFFDRLASRCEGSVSVFAGEARAGEAIRGAEDLELAEHFHARNRHILGGPLYFCWQAGLQEWLSEWQPDALIIEANPRYLSSQSAINWMQKRRGRLIGWGLGTGRGGGLTEVITSRWRSRFLDSFDALIAYSREGQESFAQLNLQDTQLFHAANAAVDATAELARKGKRDLAQILFVGRLQKRKGMERLIGASLAIQDEVAHELVIVGDGPERGNLEAIVGAEGQRIQFMGGVFGTELESLFREADLFVLPGTGGLAIQQAMSFGLPVIAGEGDGTQRDLLDASNGWQLLGTGQAELERVLIEALGDRKQLHKKGLASYAKVRDEFNLDAMTDVFVEALNAGSE
jgi:glycosyltransferase involved in cell wall biosynthesis